MYLDSHMLVSHVRMLVGTLVCICDRIDVHGTVVDWHEMFAFVNMVVLCYETTYVIVAVA